MKALAALLLTTTVAFAQPGTEAKWRALIASETKGVEVRKPDFLNGCERGRCLSSLVFRKNNQLMSLDTFTGLDGGKTYNICYYDPDLTHRVCRDWETGFIKFEHKECSESVCSMTSISEWQISRRQQ